MFWSLRNQILVPQVAILGLAVCGITLAAATLAARRVERQSVDRLNGVVEALSDASFPYTTSVLRRMRGLSGAEFIAYGSNGTATASSLDNALESLPHLPLVPRARRIQSLGASPTLELRGLRYVSMMIVAPNRPHDSSLLVLYPETSWRQAQLEAAALPLMLGGSSLLLMAIVTSWVARSISRRIGEIGRQVARIAGGDFALAESSGTRDEVADLMTSINMMCLQLREYSGRIQQTERARLLAQLAAGLAHQLRNSLTGARMSIQLHERRCPHRNGDRTLEIALRQLSMTEQQVKGLLSVGRDEDQALTGCDAHQLVRDVALLVEPACEHAKVMFDVRHAAEPVQILTNESGLQAAVLNMTLNAIEAAGPGGSVLLQTTATDESVTFEVRDSGQGPPPWLAASLFEPFSTSKPEGVGLGLTLAQRVATRLGGALCWDRVEEQTRFRLIIPRAPSSSEPVAE